MIGRDEAKILIRFFKIFLKDFLKKSAIFDSANLIKTAPCDANDRLKPPENYDIYEKNEEKIENEDPKQNSFICCNYSPTLK